MQISELIGENGNAYSASKRLLHAIKGTEPNSGIIVFPESAIVDTAKIESTLHDHRINTGYFLSGGRYTDKNGTSFSEKSSAVEILNAAAETLIEIAEEMCTKLKVTAVIVKDCNDRIYLAELD